MAHSIKVILAGFGLLVLCVLIGGAIGAPTAAKGVALAAKVFIPLWLIGAGVNMALGVKRGYSVSEEIPFFLLVFAVPAVLALLVVWRFRG